MDFDKNRAIYVQISEYISENILLKQWKEGERILSIRDMSMKLQVNPNTVMRSYAFLQNEGLLHNERGVGYFVSERAQEKIKKIKQRHYVAVELPALFKTASLLGVTPDELREYYKEYLKESKV